MSIASKALIGALIGGGSAGALNYLADPEDEEHLTEILSGAGLGAAIGGGYEAVRSGRFKKFLEDNVKPQYRILRKRMENLRDNIKRYYGGSEGLDEAISDAEDQRAENRRSGYDTSKITSDDATGKLRDKVDRDIVTYTTPEGELSNAQVGRLAGLAAIPGGGLLDPRVYLDETFDGYPSRTLEHELTHSALMSPYDLDIHKTIVDPGPSASGRKQYLMEPVEIDARLAEYKRILESRGVKVRDQQAAKKALQKLFEGWGWGGTSGMKELREGLKPHLNEKLEGHGPMWDRKTLLEYLIMRMPELVRNSVKGDPVA
jgi:hypothetical protein